MARGMVKSKKKKSSEKSLRSIMAKKRKTKTKKGVEEEEEKYDVEPSLGVAIQGRVAAELYRSLQATKTRSKP